MRSGVISVPASEQEPSDTELGPTSEQPRAAQVLLPTTKSTGLASDLGVLAGTPEAGSSSQLQRRNKRKAASGKKNRYAQRRFDSIALATFRRLDVVADGPAPVELDELD